MRRAFLIVTLLLAAPAAGQQVEVDAFVLDNGMTFLLVPRAEQPNSIAVGWVAKVGSVNERPGITGISHFFEHMMFKGTRTIGTRLPEQDANFMDRQTVIKDQLNQLIFTEQYQRFRRGEIDDPWDPANDTEAMGSLRDELRDLMEQHRDIIVKDEYAEMYAKLGGSRINAFTTNDQTFYIATVPSNKFELWAWMESDRLNDSVFREFYSERDVVHEERRLRTESSPTGEFREQFEAMFWQSSSYSWPVIGWPSDLNSYTLDQAQDYFQTYYRPNNLVGVVVGDFQPSEIKPVIREYFGRLSRGGRVPAVVTLEVAQKAPMRMSAECECQPQVVIRYHTVPFNHQDEFALQVLAELLNGRTGRLYKSMVEGAEIAASASADQDSLKYAGSFSFAAEVKGDAKPQDLETAWYEQLQRLQDEPVETHELQKVKNRLAANAFRRLRSNFFLMIQLGIFESMGGWEYINEGPVKLQDVTVQDIQRVAREYLTTGNSSVALYHRTAGPGSEDPELDALDPQARSLVKQMLGKLQQTDPARLQQMATMIEGSLLMLPEDQRPAMEYVVKKLKQRIQQLQDAGDE